MRRIVFVAALFAISSPRFAAAQDAPPPPTSHAAELSGINLETDADGKTVITLVATGDLSGLITLRLDPMEGGTFTGEWTMPVTRTETVTPDPVPDPEPPPPDDPEAEPAAPAELVRFVVRGSLTGTVSGALLTFDEDGAVTDLSASLTITSGAMEFEGLTGSGSATAATLTLTY